jgi:hypothetical protein
MEERVSETSLNCILSANWFFLHNNNNDVDVVRHGMASMDGWMDGQVWQVSLIYA